VLEQQTCFANSTDNWTAENTKNTGNTLHSSIEQSMTCRNATDSASMLTIVMNINLISVNLLKCHCTVHTQAILLQTCLASVCSTQSAALLIFLTEITYKSTCIAWNCILNLNISFKYHCQWDVRWVHPWAGLIEIRLIIPPHGSGRRYSVLLQKFLSFFFRHKISEMALPTGNFSSSDGRI